MDRVLLDTNVILDLLSFDRPGHAEAQAFLERALDEEGLEVVIAASSLNDAYHILRRHYSSEEWARDDIATLRRLFTVAELTLEVVDRALASDEPDFEDGIIRATAELVGARAIVSNDRAAFRTSPVPRRSPAEA